MEQLNLEQDGLSRLKDLKSDASKKYSDVRGWKVFSSNKINIGVVDEIIVNPEINKAVYLDIFLREDIKIKSGARHMFVKLSSTNFDSQKKFIFLTDIKTTTYLKKSIRRSKSAVRNNLKDNMKAPKVLSLNIAEKFHDNESFDRRNISKVEEKDLIKLKNHDPSKPLNSPDIRGWCVITSDSIPVGKVDDLWIDDEFNSIRYFTVKIDEGPIFDKERYILVPIDLTIFNSNDKRIVQIKININEFVSFPQYNEEPLNEYKISLTEYFKNKNNSDF